jgi:hypothetical protein
LVQENVAVLHFKIGTQMLFNREWTRMDANGNRGNANHIKERIFLQQVVASLATRIALIKLEPIEPEEAPGPADKSG